MKKTIPLNAAISGTFSLGGDLPIHRLGFGAMRLTGTGIWGPPSNIKEAHAVLRKAIDLGVNFIDTADSYGPEVSENMIAEILHPYPKGLVIATKGGLLRPGPDQWVPNCHAKYLKECVEKSLKRLKLERIDLYQLHRIDPQVPVEESLGVLKEMQKQGKIRHIGLSEVSVEEIERAKKIVPIVSIQNLYNLGNRQSDPVLSYCEKHSLAFIPWFPLDAGKLVQINSELGSLAKSKDAGIPQIALAWLLKRSPVMIPIPGTSSLAHLEENIGAASLELTNKDMDLLNSIRI